MGLLDRRVVLVTDTGDPLGRELAYAIAEAGAALVVNDPVGAGTSHAAAEEMVRSLKRRGAIAAIPSYAPLRSFRDCVTMVRTGFDRWDWISGIVFVCRSEDPTTLQNVLRAAAHPMKQWGGTIAIVNATPVAATVLTEQAGTLQESRLYVNAILPGETADVIALAVYLMSTLPISARLSGQHLRPQSGLTPEWIHEHLDALTVSNPFPAPSTEDDLADLADPTPAPEPAPEPAPVSVPEKRKARKSGDEPRKKK